jgi:hypothetical protein
MMSTFALRGLTGSLIVLLCACKPEPAGTDSAADTSTGTGASTTTVTTGDGSGSTATPTSGEAGPFCVDPQPIFQLGGEAPSGFVRCANAVVHRVEAVACAVEGQGDCMSGSECDSDLDCDDAAHGTCHQTPLTGCFCNYGCGSDADCADGEICACAGVLGKNHSQCIPAGCIDSGGCGAGLCALAAGGTSMCGALAAAEVACLDESSACLVHTDCQSDDCGACWPKDGAWSCDLLPGCDIAC